MVNLNSNISPLYVEGVLSPQEVLEMFSGPVFEPQPIDPLLINWDPEKDQNSHQNNLSTPVSGKVFSKVIQQNHIQKNTLSSKVTPLNGSTTQTSLPSRVDEIIDDKFPSLFCSLTCESFKNPVVDECGHTFERDAIMDIYHDSVRKHKPFTCPRDPSKILDVNRIVPNYDLKNVIGEIKGYVKETVNCYNKFEFMLQENRRITDEAIEEVKRSFRLEKGLDNVVNMSLYDKFINLFWQPRIITVINKNQNIPFNKANPIKRNGVLRDIALDKFKQKDIL